MPKKKPNKPPPAEPVRTVRVKITGYVTVEVEGELDYDELLELLDLNEDLQELIIEEDP
jgi:hypothetical protein